jgi:hypothetical protein
MPHVGVHVSILSKSVLSCKYPVTSFSVLISAFVQTWELQEGNFGKTLFLLGSSTMTTNVTSSELALSNPIPTLQNKTLCAPSCTWVCLKHNKTSSLEKAHKYLHHLHSASPTLPENKYQQQVATTMHTSFFSTWITITITNLTTAHLNVQHFTLSTNGRNNRTIFFLTSQMCQ